MQIATNSQFRKSGLRESRTHGEREIGVKSFVRPTPSWGRRWKSEEGGEVSVTKKEKKKNRNV